MRPFYWILVVVFLLSASFLASPAAFAQEIDTHEVRETTGNLYLETGFTSIPIEAQGTPELETHAAALSYNGGSWNLILETTSPDWAIGPEDRAVFAFDEQTYETPDLHTIDAEAHANGLREQNAILLSSQLRTVLAEADTLRLTIGDYTFNLAPLADHYALIYATLDEEDATPSDTPTPELADPTPH